MNTTTENPAAYEQKTLNAARMCLLVGLKERKLPQIIDEVFQRDVYRTQNGFERLVTSINGMDYQIGRVDPWFAMMRIRGYFHDAAQGLGGISDPRIAHLIDGLIEIARRIEPDFLLRFDPPVTAIDEEALMVAGFAS